MDTLRLDVGPEEGVSPLGRPSKYKEEFQRDAVDLVRSSRRPINHVARELGMSHETLRNWVRKQGPRPFRRRRERRDHRRAVPCRPGRSGGRLVADPAFRSGADSIGPDRAG
ncbi:transposase [Plantactinospora soyae]|uniref:transposase n=1 Tax=Plantactinospora soyae TaxID=1544732 RepID=UPI00384EFA9C